MRLDHLLSKEQLAQANFGLWRSGLATGARSVGGAQGWNIDYLTPGRAGRSQVQAAFLRRCGSGTWRWFGWVSDTLLGPEGSGNACRLERLLGLVRVCRVLLVVGPAESSA